MNENQSNRTGCLWAMVISQGLALGLIILIVLGGVALTHTAWEGDGDGGKYGVDEYPRMEEVWAEGQGDTKVVRIALHGGIFLADSPGTLAADGTADAALRAVRRATHDDDVQAIILDIDSGGGGITASDILYNALIEFKASREGRRVVAVFGDVAASGAYYVAMAADYIVAHHTTITGSIGVLIQSINAKSLAEKIGVKGVTIKSAANKDLLNPLGELTDEQRALLQAMVDEMYDRFVSLVAEGRKLPEEKVREVADGRIFTATTALELGLVDKLGYWDDAVAEAAKLLGVDGVKVYRFEERFSLRGWLRAGGPWKPVSALLDGDGGTRFLYRWSLL